MPDAGSPASPPPTRSHLLWPAAGVFAATLVAYFPALRGTFLWNDGDTVAAPALRSWHGLEQIWFQIGATLQYSPVLHSAFWVENRLWGDSPLGYHLVNVLLHATGACLFAAVLRRLAIPGAWLAALIFALHPVCVESVAWIAEQKNTLSTVFYLLSALAYLRFDREREARPYFLALGFFALALLSKSVTATLPGVLVVICWWRRGRLSWWQDIVPLLPWFVLGAGAGLFAAWMERVYVGAQGPAFALTFLDRSLIAGRVIWFYADKLIWPVQLIFIYPRWTIDASAIWQYAFPLGAMALLILLWGWRETTRAPLAAALLFIGSLFPVLGFLNVHAFVFSFVADHFVYLASLGLIALAAAGLARGLFRGSPGMQGVGRVLAAALVVGLGTLTWRQAQTYRDLPTLYRTTLDRNPACWMAHNNLALLLQEGGDLPGAIAHYQEALRLKPDYVEAHDHLGSALAASGRFEEAVPEFEEALRLEPNSADTQNNLGEALIRVNRVSDALEHYQLALRLQPDSAEINTNLGNALFQLGRATEAIEPCRDVAPPQADFARSPQ